MQISRKGTFVSERRERLERHGHERNILAIDADCNDVVGRARKIVESLPRRKDTEKPALSKVHSEYRKRAEEAWA